MQKEINPFDKKLFKILGLSEIQEILERRIKRLKLKKFHKKIIKHILINNQIK